MFSLVDHAGKPRGMMEWWNYGDAKRKKIYFKEIFENCHSTGSVKTPASINSRHFRLL
jgi:hypothetical protein